MRQISQAMLLGPWMSRPGGRKMGGVTARPKQEDLNFIKELLEAGKIAPVIDKRYTLSETADALRYLGNGHARGKIVISMEHD